jgi:formiminotetrahydrofolate cyclodeaminase
MPIADRTISDWLSRVAQPSPVWAAGSVAAMVCAEGWALVHMVAGLASKRTPAEVLSAAQERARAAQDALTQCAADDAEAVRAMVKTRGPDAFARAAEIPLRVFQWARQGQELADLPELTGYEPAALDLASCRTLFAAALSIARSLVQANAAQLDGDSRRIFLAQLDDV